MLRGNPWKEAISAPPAALTWRVAPAHRAWHRNTMASHVVDGITMTSLIVVPLIPSSPFLFQAGTSPKSTHWLLHIVEAGDEQGECWICCDATSTEPLIQPCACRGSMSGVHASCVEKSITGLISMWCIPLLTPRLIIVLPGELVAYRRPATYTSAVPFAFLRALGRGVPFSWVRQGHLIKQN